MIEDTDQPRIPLDIRHGEELAQALETDRFKQFLDHMPFAVAIAELMPQEHVTYANLEFERLSGQKFGEIEGSGWREVRAIATAADDQRDLRTAILEGGDYLGSFRIERDPEPIIVDAWSNVIEDEQHRPIFRLVALAETGKRERHDTEAYEKRVREKDLLLQELQHRVKNNLQMITALIRHENRHIPDDAAAEAFERLAGRVEALALLYRSLAEGSADQVDLGAYLSQIASAVMQAHAMEGIRLDLKVDSWPVSINVAMPTGLVVNEVMTNALKHGFKGRSGGTILLHSLVDAEGCEVVIADNGVGLPDGMTWPLAGRLSALMVDSLRQNAGAVVEVRSVPGQGVRVTIRFGRMDAAPEPE